MNHNSPLFCSCWKWGDLSTCRRVRGFPIMSHSLKMHSAWTAGQPWIMIASVTWSFIDLWSSLSFWTCTPDDSLLDHVYIPNDERLGWNFYHHGRCYFYFYSTFIVSVSTVLTVISAVEFPGSLLGSYQTSSWSIWLNSSLVMKYFFTASATSCTHCFLNFCHEFHPGLVAISSMTFRFNVASIWIVTFAEKSSMTHFWVLLWGWRRIGEIGQPFTIPFYHL